MIRECMKRTLFLILGAILLLTGCASPGAAYDRNYFYEALCEGNLDLVKECVEAGADVNDVTGRGNESGENNSIIVLLTKASYWNPAIMEYLFTQDVDVNCFDHKGVTPLMYSVGELGTFAGEPAVGMGYSTKMLLDHGADVNQKSKAGYTALDYNIKNNSGSDALLLLDYGAEVTEKTMKLAVKKCEDITLTENC